MDTTKQNLCPHKNLKLCDDCGKPMCADCGAACTCDHAETSMAEDDTDEK